MRVKQYLTRAAVLWVPLVLIIIAAIVLASAGAKDTALIVSYLGTPLVLLAVLLYVAASDPMKKWPNATIGQRLANVVTFRR